MAALPSDVGALQLRVLAEWIASGTTVLPDQGVSAAIGLQALIRGFGWAMLYGAIGVCAASAPHR